MPDSKHQWLNSYAWFKPIILAGLLIKLANLAGPWLARAFHEFMAEAASPAAPSDSELESGPGFTIESHWAIVHKLDTWYPEVVTRNGDNFIKLSKFDRKFVLFALGKPMDLSKGVARSANSLLFDKLLELRKRASEESARQQIQMPESGDAPVDHPVPKRKAKRVRAEDGCLVDPRVEIQLPELDTKTEYFLSRPAKVLWGVTSKELWIELNEPNLHHMKAMVKMGLGQQQVRKKKDKKGSPKKSPKKRLKRAAGHIGSPPQPKMTAAKSKARNKPDEKIPDTFPDTIPYGDAAPVEADDVNSTDLDESQAVQPDRQRFEDEPSD